MNNPPDNYRPWTTLEVPLGAKIRAKDGSWQSYICEVSINVIKLYDLTGIDFKYALTDCEWAPNELFPKQWNVCGVMV